MTKPKRAILSFQDELDDEDDIPVKTFKKVKVAGPSLPVVSFPKAQPKDGEAAERKRHEEDWRARHTSKMSKKPEEMLGEEEPASRNGKPDGQRNEHPGNSRGKLDPRSVEAKFGNRARTRPAEEEGTKVDKAFRERYMGPGPATSTFSVKKKRKRANEFKFDWSDSEDTTKNVAYTAPAPASKQEVDPWQQALETAKRMEEHEDYGKERAQQYLEEQRVLIERRRQRAEREKAKFAHWSEKSLEHMTERDWRYFREDFGISIRGGSTPNPMRRWDESGLPDELLDIVDRVGYEDPSPIQRAAIPIALQNRDIIGVAVTGSGKTAAFLLPLLVYISKLPRLNDATKMDGPYALILAPTRELAQQIEAEARKFATPLGFTCVSVVGGRPIEEDVRRLRDGAEIIIATPGRLVDCIERHVLVLSQCCYLIMDEADRMIDMGFEEPVNRILAALPVSNEKPDTEEAEDSRAMSRFMYRQTMMYTATMPTAVERIARSYLRRPAIVTIGNAGEATDTVEQRVEFIQGEERRRKRIAEILSQFAPPVIIFVNTKLNCNAVARDIPNRFGATAMHGSLTQQQREEALQKLKTGVHNVLVATDVAARGLDVSDVSLVINYNMPTNIETYTHRIGRTGRAGKSGVAITFLGGEDEPVLFDLKKMIQRSNISKLPEELRNHPAAQSAPNKLAKKPTTWPG